MLSTLKLKPIYTAAFLALLMSCDSDPTPDPEPEPEPELQTYYFAGIEAAIDPAADVLSGAENGFEEGTISPVGNGFEQPAWMTFLQGKDQIFAAGYTSAPEITSYELVDGELVKGESVFTDLGIYAQEVVDESTIILMGAPRSGFSEKKLYVVDSDAMTITNSALVDFGNMEEAGLMSFPTDIHLSGDKIFVSYYTITADGNFLTPLSDQAKIAVFNYPALTLDKIITDDRLPELGRYNSANVLEVDENGDMYTYASSSLACGFYPIPTLNSGIVRVKSGETSFDSDYFIDFEELSGGYKINDMFYVGNGKAVVRVVMEDETNPDYHWGTYDPTSEIPLLETGIVDLYNKTFTMLSDVPSGGGGWNSAYYIDGTKLYLGVSNSAYAGISIIDTESSTVTQGAMIEGNYAKALLVLKQ